ncbi:MAG: tripartite tricarboxylate transporter substrate binding protein [Hyphomicrobiales bacterium]|nr:tripartite tricarboxylate transporter substrate binding protein [Hyphomicrobiales bacterium]
MSKAIAFLSILALTMLTTAAGAQTYPNQPIKLMHGFPAGGNVDVLARIMAEEMAKGLGQPVVIEAKPGVVGSIAAEMIARSAPDGYKLLFLPSAHAVTAALYRSIKYDAVDDFTWISTVSFYPFVMVARKDWKIQTLGDLLREAKAHPGTLRYGSTGVGSIHHMTLELLANATGTKFVNIPYRGEGHAITGLLTGDIDFVISTVTVARPQIEAGMLRALGVTSKTRWKDLPDVPTFDEAGSPGFEVISWSGLAAPRGLPRAIVDLLNAEVRRAIDVAGVRQRLEALGGDPRATTPEDMRALVAGQVALWAKLSRDARIEVQ